MKQKQKFIVGKIIPNKTKKATIKVFDDIDYWSKNEFLSEFKYLEQSGVEEVDILINSVGGSVVDGLNIYSEIERSNMKCTTIIEGVAMSMGSIIWAAGDKLLMRDYGILMLHNPSVYSYSDDDDKDLNEMLSKFKALLKTIYCKRFNMTEEQVDAIMDGEEGIDGTYYLADEAVAAGFIPQENIIKTQPINNDEDDIYNIFASLGEKSKMAKAKVVAKAVLDKYQNKKQPKGKTNTIINQKDGKPDNSKKTNKSMEKAILAAALGLEPNAADKDVVNAITSMKDVVAKAEKLEKEKKQLSETVEAQKLKITGYETSISNLQKNKETLTKELQAYKEKEEAERKLEIEAVIDEAIKEKKIKADAKETWMDLAVKNFEQVKNMLDSIEAVSVQPITDQIANNKEGIDKAKEGMLSEAERISKAAMEQYNIK